MATASTRSPAGAHASTPLAQLISNEIELMAMRRGVQLALDGADIGVIADRVARSLVDGPYAGRLVDAGELAQQLGVAREWVYANARRLGAIRLGEGPKARLRFDPTRAREALAAGRADEDAPRAEAAVPRRRGRPRRSGPSGAPLIRGRSGR